MPWAVCVAQRWVKPTPVSSQSTDQKHRYIPHRQRNVSSLSSCVFFDGTYLLLIWKKAENYLRAQSCDIASLGGLFQFSCIDNNMWLTETNLPCSWLRFWVAINSSRCPLAAVSQASEWAANVAFVHLSLALSPPTFTVKGWYNGTSGTVGLLPHSHSANQGMSARPEQGYYVTAIVLLIPLQETPERKCSDLSQCWIFLERTQIPPIEVTDLLFSFCVFMCVCPLLSSFLCSWVWSSSWSWLQGSLPLSLRTGSKTSLTFSSTIMSRPTAMTLTCRISSTSPRNMWVHNYWQWNSLFNRVKRLIFLAVKSSLPSSEMLFMCVYNDVESV